MDLGAELEAGGQAGKGQSLLAGARPGRELSTNWLKPASGNLATGLASEAPSFRSSWQAQVNAWRGVSRGTNGVESQDASEAETADATSGALISRAANPGKISPSAQESNSSLPSSSLSSSGVVTKQNVSIPAASQKESWSDTGRSVAVENPVTQIASAGSTDATATERQAPATRSRAGSAVPPLHQENTAPATSVGPQPVVPVIETPIQPPVAPAQLEIPALAQSAEAISASEPDFAPSNWHSTQFSEPAQLSRPEESSAPAQLSGPRLSDTEENANAAIGKLASDNPGSDTTAPVRTQATRSGPSIIPHNAAPSQATHQTAASSLRDADESTGSRPLTSLSSPEARSAESWREPSTAHTAASNESLSGQSAESSSTVRVNHPATVENIAPSAASLVTVPAAVQASANPVPEVSKQFTDRATPRATNRDAAGESTAGATQISAAQPIAADAAAPSGLRIPGAPQGPTASAPHDQPVASAASAASPTQNTFSALDAGPSPSTPAWTHAGSLHAEAGFRDPALGWVSVRADLNGGGIHATLVPSSAEAAQALNGHLAGLSTHLVEQQSPVASLTMASPSESGMENGMGQRMQQGAEGNPQGSTPQETQAGSQGKAPPASSTSVLDAPAQTGILDSFTHSGDLRGTHISVMA
jgi:hypothetical protein